MARSLSTQLRAPGMGLLLLASLAAVGLAAPAPAPDTESAQIAGPYYAFYDDYECEGNLITKTHFNSDNTGCFNMNGAKCAKRVGGDDVLDIPTLVAYSAPDCQDADELGCNGIGNRGTYNSMLPFNGKYIKVQGR